MSIFQYLIILCWAVFLVIWILSAFRAKRTIGGSRPILFLNLLRIAVVIVAVSLVHAGVAIQPFQMTAINPILGTVGVSLCALGIAFAVWARIYLGSNWGMPMSVKESPELVTSGPYAYVRHPIYTGVIVGMLGTMLVVGSWWVIVIIAGGLYFVYSATREEKLMLKEFPDTYPAYKARTKMLVPFIF